MSLALTLTERFHNIVRQASVRTVYEALVELVTNSADAYQRAGIDRRDIRISVVRGGEKTLVRVIDQAGGMDGESMIKALLTVGGYTAGSESRGMMGRGSKDCSNIGDVCFTSIHKRLVNQVVIYQNMSADHLISDGQAEPAAHDSYGILEQGFCAELRLDPSMVSDAETLYSKLSKNVCLRRLFSDPNYTIVLDDGDFARRVQYSYPERRSVISCEYDIPEYNTKATLQLFYSEQEIPFAQAGEVEYGALVCSDSAVYECSAFYHSTPGVQDYIWSPNIRHITGVLHCADIDRLAREAANGQLTAANPYLCIDSNRRTGLVKDHPFTKALFGEAYKVLEIVLNRVQDARDEELLDSGGAKDFFDSLNSMIEGLLPPESALYTWRSKKDHQNLAEVAAVVKNVQVDSEFLGLTWEEIQNLTRDKYLNIDESEPVQNNFRISFTDSRDLKTSYQILYMPGRISLKINALDPTIRDYLRVKDGKVEFINSGKALVGVGNMVSEATTNMIVRRKIMSGKTSALDISGFNEYMANVNETRARLVGRIHDHVASGITGFKAGV